MDVSSVPHTPCRSDQPEADVLDRPVVVVRPLGNLTPPDHWNPEWPGRNGIGSRSRKGFGSSSAAFVAALAERGWKISDAMLWAAGSDVGLYRPRFRRGFRWSSLPSVGEPELMNELYVTPIGEDGCGVGQDVLGGDPFVLRPTVTAIVVDCHLMDDAVLWNAVGSVWKAVSENGVDVLWFDGKRMHDLGRDRVARAADLMRPIDRLVSNFTLNFAVMASRAVVSIASESGWSPEHLRCRLPRLGIVSWRTFTPLAMQMLYALDHIHLAHEPVRHRDARDILNGWDALVTACPWIAYDKARRLATFTWRGSGRYRPFVCELLHPMRFKESLADAEGYGVWRTLIALESAGFIALDDTGRMGISPYGRKMLWKVGRSAEDADVILRWRDGGSDAVPAVDRWLHRAFRKMKRRVADLPASPFLEDVQGELPDPRCPALSVV